MKKLLLSPLAAALLPVLLLAGCNPAPTTGAAPASPAAQAKVAEDSVLAQHERLMGQADQVIALAARLQAAPHPPRPLLARLQAADRAMMDWMHHYQAPDSLAPAPQRLAYLQAQQHQLAGIGQQMRLALDSGAAALRRQPAVPMPAVPAPAGR